MGNIWDLVPQPKKISIVACTCYKLTFNIPNWIYYMYAKEKKNLYHGAAIFLAYLKGKLAAGGLCLASIYAKIHV